MLPDSVTAIDQVERASHLGARHPWPAAAQAFKPSRRLPRVFPQGSEQPWATKPWTPVGSLSTTGCEGQQPQQSDAQIASIAGPAMCHVEVGEHEAVGGSALVPAAGVEIANAAPWQCERCKN